MPSFDPAAFSPEPSVKHIDQALAKVPPLSQQQLLASFVGAPVAWDVVFFSGTSLDQTDPDHITLQGSVRLRMYYFYTIFTRLYLADYPDLRTLEQGRILTIYGRILKVETLSIHLDLAGLVIKPHHFWDRGY